jgi:hypothetical protein
MCSIFRLCILLLLKSSLALANYSVSPLTLELPAPGGEERTGYLEIRNTGDIPVSVKLYKQDFLVESNGQEKEFPSGELERGCADWITMSPSGVISLEPGKTQDVKVRIQAPEKIEGSYWAKIFAEQLTRPKPVEAQHNGMTMQLFIKQRWEVRIHSTVPGTENPNGEITTLNVDLPSEENPLSFTMTFVNQGNTLLQCNGYVDVKNEDGETVEKSTFAGEGSFNIYPNGERILKATLKEPLPAGDYIALAVIDYGGDALIAGEIEFSLEAPLEEITEVQKSERLPRFIIPKRHKQTLRLSKVEGICSIYV